MEIHNGLKGIGRYDRLSRAKKFIIGKTLDVGCSNGALLALCKEIDIMGIEPDEEMVKEAKRWGKVIKARGESIPFPDKSFDTVTCLDVIEHVENREKTLSEIARVTKKRVILSFPKRPFKGHPGFLLEPPRINDFKIIHIEYTIPVTPIPYKNRVFNNEKDMKTISKKWYFSIFTFLRPVILSLFKLRIIYNKNSMLIVYDRIR